jgi:uncharacterized protein DUF6508
MPWFSQNPQVGAFVAALYEHGWIVAFDWPDWQDEAAALVERGGIVEADASTLRRLLTLLVRKDRFAEGQLAAAFESGLIVTILRRLKELMQAGAQGGMPPVMEPTSPDPIATAAPEIAARMRALAADLGSTAALREVKHLEPSTVAALKQAYPGREVEKNRKLPIPSWSPIGNVDVVMHPASDGDPLVAAELKRCYHDKLYEGIWDLFKMALLATRAAQTYLVTGATPHVWSSSVGRELFTDGIHTPTELCRLRLSWRQKLRAWDDLLWGGHDKCPAEVPSKMRTTLVAREVISGTDGEWELRAVRVEPVGETMTVFRDGWPFPRPADAVRPLRYD